MKNPNITTLKKYVLSLSKMKAKYVTADRLSRVIGIYPEIICENLSYFEPTLLLDRSFNLLELVPVMKKYIADEEEKKVNNLVHKEVATKKNVEEFESISDFIYKKMTNGLGLVDKGAKLSEKDLRILKRLVTEELTKQKKK